MDKEIARESERVSKAKTIKTDLQIEKKGSAGSTRLCSGSEDFLESKSGTKRAAAAATEKKQKQQQGKKPQKQRETTDELLSTAA